MPSATLESVGLTQNNSMNKLIAITGGIGSGKSTALKIINKLGYKSFNADLTYKQLLDNDDFVIKVSSEMEVPPLYENGKLKIDRKGISEKVFNDKTWLAKLNSITHPAIMNEMLTHAKKEEGLVFCEVPLLFEGGFENLFDYVFIITRSIENRIKSVSIRDGKSPEEVERILKNQFDYAKISKGGHTIFIDNYGDENCLERELKFAIEKIKS